MCRSICLYIILILFPFIWVLWLCTKRENRNNTHLLNFDASKMEIWIVTISKHCKIRWILFTLLRHIAIIYHLLTMSIPILWCLVTRPMLKNDNCLAFHCLRQILYFVELEGNSSSKRVEIARYVIFICVFHSFCNNAGIYNAWLTFVRRWHSLLETLFSLNPCGLWGCDASNNMFYYLLNYLLHAFKLVSYTPM